MSEKAKTQVQVSFDLLTDDKFRYYWVPLLRNALYIIELKVNTEKTFRDRRFSVFERL